MKSTIALLCFLSFTATALGAAADPTKDASTPKPVTLRILGQTYRSDADETVAAFMERAVAKDLHIKHLCDTEGNGVDGAHRVAQVWSEQGEHQVSLHPIRYHHHETLHEAYVCAGDMVAEGKLLKALGIGDTTFHAPDFESLAVRNHRYTPLYVVGNGDLTNPHLRRVVDHFGHTHYFIAADLAELMRKVQQRGAQLEHPVWSDGGRVRLCDQNGQRLKEGGGMPNLFVPRHVLVNSGNYAAIVSVCHGDTFKSLLSGDKAAHIDGVDDLETVIGEQYMATTYPVTTAKPILVLQTAPADYKYVLRVGKECFTGVATCDAANRTVTAGALRKKLAKDLQQSAIFHSGPASLYVSFDRGASQAICDGKGAEVDELTIPPATTTLELSAEAVTMQLGDCFEGLTQKKVTFTVCKWGNTAANIRRRLTDFFSAHTTAKLTLAIKTGSRAVPIADMASEAVVAAFGPGKTVTVEAMEYLRPSSGVELVAYKPASATLLRALTDHKGNRRWLLAASLVLLAVIIASLLFYFMCEDDYVPDEPEVAENIAEANEAIV